MNRVKCAFCNYIGRPDNVKAHVNSKHEKNRPFCDCGKDFANKSSLKRHSLVCQIKKPIENFIDVHEGDSVELNVVDGNDVETKQNVVNAIEESSQLG